MIHPVGRAVFYHPAKDGMETLLGCSFDWRPRDVQWSLVGMEYIEPLECLAPIADLRPKPMLWAGATAWTPETSAPSMAGWNLKSGVANTAIRSCVVSGNPSTRWLHFYDATVYGGAQIESAYARVESPSCIHTERIPRFALHLIHYATPTKIVDQPPADDPYYTDVDADGNTIYVQTQGVQAGLAVSLEAFCWDGGWYGEKGQLSLVIPHGEPERTSPFLHWISDADAAANPGWNYWTPNVGQILDEAPGGMFKNADQPPYRRTWLFEAEDDGSTESTPEADRQFTGTHILIRCSDEPTRVWHFYAERMRFLPASTVTPWTITVQGAVTFFNLTPVRYGQNTEIKDVTSGTAYHAYALPRLPGSLPTVRDALGAEIVSWNPDVSYSVLTTSADGWTTGANPYAPDVGVYRPFVWANRTLDAGSYERPLIWLAGEDHPTEIGAENSDTPATTEGSGLCESITYTTDSDWRGARGTVGCYAMVSDLHALVRENAKVVLSLGWDADAGAGLTETVIAHCYVMPGGIMRVADGSDAAGYAKATIELGDFSLARMPEKAVFNFRQAGGRTFLDWAQDLTGRLGLPSSMLYVSPSLGALTIPISGAPSEPCLAPDEGTRWDAHIEQVCAAMSVPGQREVRWGFGKYAFGQLFFDYVPEYDGTVAFTLDHDTLTAKDTIYRIEHSESRGEYCNVLKVNGPDGPVYFGEEWDDRAAFGDTWTKVVEYTAGQSGTEVGLRSWLQRHEWHEAIAWDGPLRPDLWPDQFVRVGSVEVGMGMSVGEVYRIVSHTLSANRTTNEATSHIEAVRVV